MNRKIFVVGIAGGYTNWTQSERTYDMKKADVVMFTGGEDINPALYGKESHPFTSCNPVRDAFEVNAFKQARDLKKPMIGICRGAQLLCVMNGGLLVQHQTDEYFLHYIRTYDNQKDILTSSCHHQAAFPFKLPEKKYKILGWTEGLSKIHQGIDWKDDMNPPVECEVVFYPKWRCLGIQGHPEMMFYREGLEDSVKYFQNLLTTFLDDKI
jgi:gamma-glutamyl-gamma-aminobutyrate hydrolase PuuD